MNPKFKKLIVGLTTASALTVAGFTVTNFITSAQYTEPTQGQLSPEDAQRAMQQQQERQQAFEQQLQTQPTGQGQAVQQQQPSIQSQQPQLAQQQFVQQQQLQSQQNAQHQGCLLYTSPSPRDKRQSRMPSSA